MAEQPFLVTPGPHLKSSDDVGSIMSAVAIALVPAFVFALYQFGYYAWMVTALSVGTACLTEAVCQRLRGRPVTLDDWSAVVTGLLLAAVLPPNCIWYVPVFGAVVAIGIAKHCFGGLGSNIWNPALLGRAFLQAAFPTEINAGAWPAARGESFWGSMAVNLRGSFDELAARSQEAGTDVVSSATPLEQLARVAELGPATEAGGAQSGLVFVRDGAIDLPADLYLDAFLGNVGGCIGEVSALALLFGGLYLLGRRIITWHVPLGYLATVALLGWVLPAPFQTAAGGTAYTAFCSGPWLLHLVGGGLFIGAFFMATDMVTNPISRTGQFWFGVGCGVLTILIRLYGGYPEGVCYSILLMNTVVPLIDSWTRPRVFGTALDTGGDA